MWLGVIVKASHQPAYVHSKITWLSQGFVITTMIHTSHSHIPTYLPSNHILHVSSPLPSASALPDRYMQYPQSGTVSLWPSRPQVANQQQGYGQPLSMARVWAASVRGMPHISKGTDSTGQGAEDQRKGIREANSESGGPIWGMPAKKRCPPLHHHCNNKFMICYPRKCCLWQHI